MDLTERLETVRQDYVDRLALAMHEAKSTPGARVVTEAIVRDVQGQPLREGALKLPCRVDVLLVKEGAASEIVRVATPLTSPPVPFEAVTFEAAAGGLQVAIYPFRWDCLRVHLLDGSAAMEWEPLLSWFEEWFRIDEDGTGDLLLAVHSLSDPEDVADGTTLAIDMGSAPVNAIEELLDALAGLDVSRIELGEPGAAEDATPLAGL